MIWLNCFFNLFKTSFDSLTYVIWLLVSLKYFFNSFNNKYFSNCSLVLSFIISSNSSNFLTFNIKSWFNLDNISFLFLHSLINSQIFFFSISIKYFMNLSLQLFGKSCLSSNILYNCNIFFLKIFWVLFIIKFIIDSLLMSLNAK